MANRAAVLTVLVLSWTLPAAAQQPVAQQAVAQQAFSGQCREGKLTLPGAVPVPTPIDAVCSERGDPKAPPFQQAENSAKNNFCAVNWPPQQMTFKDMIELETRTGKLAAAREKSPDRSLFAKMGEGRTVQIRGYILTVRREGAESVNCGRAVPPSTDYADFHIPLVERPGLDECSSIVIEMSPHYRPAAWNLSVLRRVGTSIPVRVTGQLFLDTAHTVCVKGQRMAGQAPRASRWEIHPVYRFEVCPSQKCGDTGWVSLESYAAQ